MKVATIIGLAVFVACLGAQTQPAQNDSQAAAPDSQTVNLDGTLVDQSCATAQMQKNTNSDADTVIAECPATVSTTTFGLITSDGKFARFDDTSSAKVGEMMKSNQDWADAISAQKPIKVHVVATPNGDQIAIKEIQ